MIISDKTLTLPIGSIYSIVWTNVIVINNKDVDNMLYMYLIGLQNLNLAQYIV